jgi:hypothetical protein
MKDIELEENSASCHVLQLFAFVLLQNISGSKLKRRNKQGRMDF